MQRGDRFPYKGEIARVMTVTEGWVVARKKGCMPFLVRERRAAQLLREPSETVEGNSDGKQDESDTK